MKARIQALSERRPWLIPLAVMAAALLGAFILCWLGIPPPPLPGAPPLR